MPHPTASDDPLVTVFINAYNYGRFLGRAIESAIAQTYPPSRIEILVVDDGSTDETPQIVQRYANRVRYVRKARGGQASALNEGFRQAQGDIICLLDADDYFYPDKVRRVVEVFRDSPGVGLVYNNINIVDNAGTIVREVPWGRTWTCRKVRLSSVPAQLQSLILLGHPWNCMTSSMSLHKSAAERLEVPEDLFHHSADLFLGIVLPFMAEVRLIDTALTAYVFHGENLVLFRSSPANRELLKRQLAYVRRYVEDRFGKRFVTYFGRNVYGPEADTEWQKESGFGVYLADFKQIARSNVQWSIKWESQLRLLASFLLPIRLYDGLRHVRVAQRRLLRSRYGP
jgi:glycosyltransferase involved in cell wall biosynthesis